MDRAIANRWVMVATCALLGGAAATAFRFGRSSGPCLCIDKEVLDLGSIPVGQVAEGSVQLTNCGTSTLVVTKVHLTCGCAEASLTKSELEPGDAATLRVTMRAKGVPGRSSVSVYVASNDAGAPLKELTVTSAVSDEPFLEPSLIDFGRVDRSQLPITTRAKLFLGAKEHSTISASAADPFLMTDVDAHVQSSTVFEISLSADAPSGALASEIRIRAADSDVELRTNVIGYVRGSVYALPMTLVLDPITADATLSEVVQVKSRSAQHTDDVFTIASVVVSQSMRPMVSADVAPEKGAHAIVVRVAPSRFAGVWSAQQLRGYLRVHIARGADREELNVPLLAILRAPKERN